MWTSCDSAPVAGSLGVALIERSSAHAADSCRDLSRTRNEERVAQRQFGPVAAGRDALDFVFPRQFMRDPEIIRHAHAPLSRYLRQEWDTPRRHCHPARFTM